MGHAGIARVAACVVRLHSVLLLLLLLRSLEPLLHGLRALPQPHLRQGLQELRVPLACLHQQLVVGAHRFRRVARLELVPCVSRHVTSRCVCQDKAR